MLRIVLCLLLASYPFVVSAFGARHLYALRGAHEIPAGAADPSWFQQKLDHFNPQEQRMWPQKYFVNSTFFKSGGPGKPKPQTPNPKPQTPNPKPQTLTPLPPPFSLFPVGWGGSSFPIVCRRQPFHPHAIRSAVQRPHCCRRAQILRRLHSAQRLFHSEPPLFNHTPGACRLCKLSGFPPLSAWHANAACQRDLDRIWRQLQWFSERVGKAEVSPPVSWLSCSLCACACTVGFPRVLSSGHFVYWPRLHKCHGLRHGCHRKFVKLGYRQRSAAAFFQHVHSYCDGRRRGNVHGQPCKCR